MNCLKQEQGQDPFSLTLETAFLLWQWSSAGGDLVPDNGDTVGFHSVKGLSWHLLGGSQKFCPSSETRAIGPSKRIIGFKMSTVLR